MRVITSIIGLLCAAAAIFPANSATIDPILVYCDEEFTAIPRVEIDSITFSRYDMDSVLRADIATQVVWTGDTPYRYPVEKTDSVLFVPPVVNKLMPGTREITGSFWTYVTSCEKNQILHINPSIPSYLMPSVGERLVTTEMSSKFPTGFIGEVTSIDQRAGDIIVNCEPLDLTDVYETFFGSFEREITNNGQISESADTESDQPSGIAPKALSGDNTFSLPTFKRSFSFGGNFDIGTGLNIGTQNALTFSVKPTLRVRTTTMIEGFGKLNSTAMVIADFDCEETLSTSFTGSFSRSVDLTNGMLSYPVAPGVELFFEGGLAFNVSGSWGMESHHRQHYRVSALATMATGGAKNALKPTLQSRLVDSDFGIDNAIGEASISLGGYVKFGVAPIRGRKLLNLNVNANFGYKTVLNAGVTAEDIEAGKATSGKFYDVLSRQDAIQAGPFFTASLAAEALDGHLEDHVDLYDQFRPTFQSSIFPRITNVKAERRKDDKSTVDLIAYIQPGLLDCKFGWRIYEKNESNQNIIIKDWRDIPSYYDVFGGSINNIALDRIIYFVPTIGALGDYWVSSDEAYVNPIPAKKVVSAKYVDSYFTLSPEEAERINDIYAPESLVKWIELNIPIERINLTNIDLSDVTEIGLYAYSVRPKGMSYNEHINYYNEFINSDYRFTKPIKLDTSIAELKLMPISMNPISSSISIDSMITYPFKSPFIEFEAGRVFGYGYAGIYVKRTDNNCFAYSLDPWHFNIEYDPKTYIENFSYNGEITIDNIDDPICDHWPKFMMDISFDVKVNGILSNLVFWKHTIWNTNEGSNFHPLNLEKPKPHRAERYSCKDSENRVAFKSLSTFSMNKSFYLYIGRNWDYHREQLQLSLDYSTLYQGYYNIFIQFEGKQELTDKYCPYCDWYPGYLAPTSFSVSDPQPVY